MSRYLACFREFMSDDGAIENARKLLAALSAEESRSSALVVPRSLRVARATDQVRLQACFCATLKSHLASHSLLKLVVVVSLLLRLRW